MKMKLRATEFRNLSPLWGLVLTIGVCFGQGFPVTPANPTEFKGRSLGGSLGSSVAGVQKVKPVTQTLHYIAVSDLRAFESNEGKKLMAWLIAFEPGDPESKPVTQPLTVIRDGKIRLWVEGKQKLSTVPLDRLKASDQEYVKQVAKTAGVAGEKESASAKSEGGSEDAEDPNVPKDSSAQED